MGVLADALVLLLEELCKVVPEPPPADAVKKSNSKPAGDQAAAAAGMAGSGVGAATAAGAAATGAGAGAAVSGTPPPPGGITTSCSAAAKEGTEAPTADAAAGITAAAGSGAAAGGGGGGGVTPGSAPSKPNNSHRGAHVDVAAVRSKLEAAGVPAKLPPSTCKVLLSGEVLRRLGRHPHQHMAVMKEHKAVAAVVEKALTAGGLGAMGLKSPHKVVKCGAWVAAGVVAGEGMEPKKLDMGAADVAVGTAGGGSGDDGHAGRGKEGAAAGAEQGCSAAAAAAAGGAGGLIGIKAAGGSDAGDGKVGAMVVSAPGSAGPKGTVRTPGGKGALRSPGGGLGTPSGRGAGRVWIAPRVLKHKKLPSW